MEPDGSSLLHPTLKRSSPLGHWYQKNIGAPPLWFYVMGSWIYSLSKWNLVVMILFNSGPICILPDGFDSVKLICWCLFWELTRVLILSSSHFQLKNSPTSLILLHAVWGSKIRLVFKMYPTAHHRWDGTMYIRTSAYLNPGGSKSVKRQFRTFWLYTPFSCYRIRVPKAQWEFSGGFSCQKQMAEGSFKVDSYTN